MEIQIADDEPAPNDINGSDEETDNEHFGLQMMFGRKQQSGATAESMNQQEDKNQIQIIFAVEKSDDFFIDAECDPSGNTCSNMNHRTIKNRVNRKIGDG